MNNEDFQRLLDIKDTQISNLSHRLEVERKASQETIDRLNSTISYMATIDAPWNQPMYLQLHEYLLEIVTLIRGLLKLSGKYAIHNKARTETRPEVQALLMKVAQILDWMGWDD